MGTSIIITSGKGGTGKTTAAAAIASSLALLGHSVLCLDGDMMLRNLDLSLGMSDTAVMNFYDVLDGRCSLDSAAAPHSIISGLYLLTAPVNIAPEAIDKSAMQVLMNKIRRIYDYCIIDSPAGIGSGFSLAAGLADSAVVVGTADDSSCRDAGRTVAELSALGITDIRLIVNRVKPRLLKKAASNIDDIVDSVGARLIGLIPEDDKVLLAANLGKPLLLCTPRKGAAKAFYRTAMRLDGARVPLTNIK